MLANFPENHLHPRRQTLFIEFAFSVFIYFFDNLTERWPTKLLCIDFLGQSM